MKQLERIVSQIRSEWSDVKIVIRGDGGFCRDRIMDWCESNDVDFVLGLAKNSRLKRALGKELHEAKLQFEATNSAARVFKDFEYQTKKSWSRKRRVIGKAEHLAKGDNPRFVVTSLSADEYDAATVYEQEYCARGDMENRIKEQQLYLFADRTSASTMRANQLRLWFSSVAYVLLNALRELALAGTELERAKCSTIRLKLLKVGAAIRVTVRKVWVSMSSSYPLAVALVITLASCVNAQFSVTGVVTPGVTPSARNSDGPDPSPNNIAAGTVLGEATATASVSGANSRLHFEVSPTLPKANMSFLVNATGARGGTVASVSGGATFTFTCNADTMGKFKVRLDGRATQKPLNRAKASAAMNVNLKLFRAGSVDPILSRASNWRSLDVPATGIVTDTFFTGAFSPGDRVVVRISTFGDGTRAAIASMPGEGLGYQRASGTASVEFFAN